MYRVHLNGWYRIAPHTRHAPAQWTRCARQATHYPYHTARSVARPYGADIEPADHDNRAALL